MCIFFDAFNRKLTISLKIWRGKQQNDAAYGESLFYMASIYIMKWNRKNKIDFLRKMLFYAKYLIKDQQ